MKRKLSLLLAFVMIFSLLPMTVAGADIGPNRTGVRREVHPLDSILHMRDGTVVARTGVGAHWVNNHDRHERYQFEISAAAPVHVTVAADYFHARRDEAGVPADVTMNLNLSNAYWLIHHMTYSHLMATVPATVSAILVPADTHVASFEQRYLGPALPGHYLVAWLERGPRPNDARLRTAIVAYNGIVASVVNTSVLSSVNAVDLQQYRVYLPIEFLTRSGANENPIVLTFQALHNWRSPGPMTVSATPQDGRFVISRPGTMRVFHEFGRAPIRDHIRIAEGTPGAFRANQYWVEFEIVTTGFEWTTASLGFEIASRHGNAPLGLGGAFATQQNWGGTQNNNRRIIQFVLHLPNATSTERLQMDWLNFLNLEILATDRARDGYVEVDVRVFNAVGGGTGTGAQNVSWSYRAADFSGNSDFYALSAALRADVRALAATYARAHFFANLVSTPPRYYAWANLVTQTEDGVTWTVVDNVWVRPATSALTPPLGYTAMGFIVPHEIFTVVGGAGNWSRGTLQLASTRIQVARFGQIGLELFVHEDDDVEDFALRSGMQEWVFWNDLVTQGAGWNVPGGAVNLPGSITNRGAVQPDSPNADFHRTARVVLREVVPGSLPGTGAAPTTFTFDEGVQVLGVRFWTNNGPFIDAERQLGNRNYHHLHGGNDTAWFGIHRTGDNPMRASITRNTVTIRPELGRVAEAPRYNIAEITAEFYLSVKPGFEHLVGDEIVVTVDSGTVAAPFQETAVIAYAYDPIFVETTPIVIDETEAATFGLVRGVSIEDIVITETYEGLLMPGQIIWIGVEGGVSRSWGRADHLSLMAGNVRVAGCDRLQVSSPRSNSHGVYVEVIRASNTVGAQIIFEDVVVSGAILPNQSYNIMVAGDAVAGNWNGFAWLVGHETGSALGRTTLHGFFSEEPYAELAFTFEGADTALVNPPQPPVGPQQPINQAVTFFQTSSHTLRDGDVVSAPVFVLRPNVTNPNFVTSYVSARVVADLAGLPWGNGFSNWDDAAGTATFTDGNVSIAFTAGSSVAVVNGVDTPITAGGLSADAQIIGGRMMVPISFFNTIPWFPLNVRWNSYVDPSQRSITITPVGQ